MMTAASSKPMDGMSGISQMSGMSGHGHQKKPDVSFTKKLGVILFSAACLLLAVLITSWIVELKV